MNGEKRTTRQPIVCGTDFSATATEAVDIAAALARRLETRLVFVHVDQLGGSLASDPFVLEAAILQRRGELDRQARRLRDLGTEVEERFVSGSAFDELVTAATEAKGRLIVVGAVGHSLARRVASGQRSRAYRRGSAGSNISRASWREARFLDSRRAPTEMGSYQRTSAVTSRRSR